MIGIVCDRTGIDSLPRVSPSDGFFAKVSLRRLCFFGGLPGFFEAVASAVRLLGFAATANGLDDGPEYISVEGVDWALMLIKAQPMQPIPRARHPKDSA